MSLEMEVEASRKIEEGKHEGSVVDVKKREGTSKKTGKDYKYVDLKILEKSGVELKSSYSAYITKESGLGQLLARFGVVLEKGKKIDIEAALMDKKCTFLTQDRTTDKGTFSDVIPNSVKPAA